MSVSSAVIAVALASGAVPAAAVEGSEPPPAAQVVAPVEGAAPQAAATSEAAAPATTDVPTPPATPAPVPAPVVAKADAAHPAPPEIVVSGRAPPPKQDPAMVINQATFKVTEAVDKALVGPVAMAYKNGLPGPIRSGLHNFFYNLTEPVNIINFVLQLKPVSAARTLARFGINTTLGVAGLLDVAKRQPFNLHYRPNGVANTLGYYGIGPGPYMFLPFVGPTSVRDLIGTLVDQVVLPVSFGKPFNSPYYVLPANTVQTLDYRVIIDDDLNKVRQSGHAYSSYREIYLETRREEIEALHGRGPLAKGEVGEAPFAKPLYPEAKPAEPAAPAKPVAETPPPPEPAAAPASAPAPAPVAPPPPVFVSHPVVQPLPGQP